MDDGVDCSRTVAEMSELGHACTAGALVGLVAVAFKVPTAAATDPMVLVPLSRLLAWPDALVGAHLSPAVDAVVAAAAVAAGRRWKLRRLARRRGLV
jgi:hypothetical protein